MNPSVPLSFVSPQVESPAQAMGQAMTIRNMGDQHQLHQAQMEDVQAQAQERQRVLEGNRKAGELYAQTTKIDPNTGAPVPDHDAVIQGLNASGHVDLANKISANVRAATAATLANDEKRWTNLGKVTDMTASVLAGIEHNPFTGEEYSPEQKEVNYKRAMDLPITKTLLGATGEQAPPDYKTGKDWVQAHYAAALTAKEQVATVQNGIKFHQEILEKQPKLIDQWNKIAYNKLATAGNQQQWDAYKNALVQQKAPQTLIDEIGDYSPENVSRVKNLALTEEQRQQQAERALIHDENLDERKRHNVETESIRRDVVANRPKSAAEVRQEENTRIDTLAQKALSDSRAHGDSNKVEHFDWAAANVRDPNNYQNSEIEDSDREKIAQRLMDWKARNLKPKQVQAGIDRAEKANSDPMEALRQRLAGSTGTPTAAAAPRSTVTSSTKTAVPKTAGIQPPPKSVVDKLQPGEHKFSNGQTWRKNADGSMEFVSATGRP